MASNLFCRVCGLKQKSPPWGEDEHTPSFEICACCGAEFGYNDCNPDSAKKYRQIWINLGAKWFDPKKKPEGWDLYKQLANLPNELQEPDTKTNAQRN